MSFHLNFSNEDDNYGYATILFIVVPFVLTLTIGQGYLELHEAATMEKFKKRLQEILSGEGLPEEIIKEKVDDVTPGIGKRILFVIQTFTSFLPGLSWIPLPKEVADAGDGYNQTLLKRKMFELFGENTCQFILQLAIELSKSDSKITSISTLFETMATNLTIASSLFGLILRSTTVYMELASKDKYGVKTEPYACFKAKIIVVPLMFAAILPRILTYSICIGSSFPLHLFNETARQVEGGKRGTTE